MQEEYGCLPPHFNTKEGPALSTEEWDTILPGFIHYPSSFRAALPFLLASLLHHFDFIHQNYHPQHPIFSSRLFTLPAQRISELRARVHVGNFKNKTTGMEARGTFTCSIRIMCYHVLSCAIMCMHAGIPNEVRILHRLDQQDELRLKDKEEMLKKISEQPEAIKRMLLENFEINGAQPLLESRVRELIENSNNNLRDGLLAEIRQLRVRSGPVEESTPVDAASQEWPGGTVVDGYMMWTWGGRLHMVPEGWCLPKGTVSALFNLWVAGNQAMRLRPYRFLKGYDLRATEKNAGKSIPLVWTPEVRKKLLKKVSANYRAYLSQARDVMIVISNACEMTFQQLAALSATEREAKYLEAFQSVIKRLHPDKSDEQLDRMRVADNAWTTMFRSLSKAAMLRKTLGKRKRKA